MRHGEREWFGTKTTFQIKNWFNSESRTKRYLSHVTNCKNLPRLLKGDVVFVLRPESLATSAYSVFGGPVYLSSEARNLHLAPARIVGFRDYQNWDYHPPGGYWFAILDVLSSTISYGKKGFDGFINETRGLKEKLIDSELVTEEYYHEIENPSNFTEYKDVLLFTPHPHLLTGFRRKLPFLSKNPQEIRGFLHNYFSVLERSRKVKRKTNKK